METIAFKTSVNMGDLLAALAGIKQVCGELGKKAKIYQRVNMKAHYYDNAVHPIKDSDNDQVSMNEASFNFIKPLIDAQDYIYSFEIYSGQPIDVDLDIARYHVFTGMPNGAIQNWNAMAFPDMQADLSKQWINVPTGETQVKSDEIIINFTERWRNRFLTYFFLKEHEDKIWFAGLPKEYDDFCKEWGLNLRHLQCDNFLDLSLELNRAKFFLGNQSAIWNCVEGMKKPRILEVCQFAQNCIQGVGEHSYGYLHQGAVEFYFKKLLLT